MARKRRIVTAPTRSARRSSAAPRRNSRQGTSTRRKAVWLVLALAAALTVGYVGWQIAQPPPPPDLTRVKPSMASLRPPPPAAATADLGGAPDLQLPPDHPASEEVEPPAPAADGILRSAPPGLAYPGGPVRLAIVIDDLGRSLADVDILTAIGVPLTYSVLPFETRTADVVARLNAAGAEILCHLPMEPQGVVDPGPGALRSTMSEDELVAATQRALAAVPGAAGANNHMGSGLSTHRSAMTAVLGVLADRGLYYLDSRTTADTVGYTVARELGLAAAERQVFLDAERNPAFIRAQFQRLLEVARARGGAIAIAHPYPETLSILREALPQLAGRGFELVPASHLVDRSG